MREHDRAEIYITYKAQRKPLSVWAKEMDVSTKTLYQRIVRRKWSVTRAMETPFRDTAAPALESKRKVVEYTDEND